MVLQVGDSTERGAGGNYTNTLERANHLAWRQAVSFPLREQEGKLLREQNLRLLLRDRDRTSTFHCDDNSEAT